MRPPHRLPSTTTRANLRHTGAATDYPEAAAANARALQIRVTTLGEKHPDTAQSLNNHAMVLVRLGDAAGAAGAAELHERALAANRVVYGEMHTRVTASLSDLGRAHLTLDNAPRALEPMTQALAIQETLLGPNHANVATTEYNIAGAKDMLRRPCYVCSKCAPSAQPLLVKSTRLGRGGRPGRRRRPPSRDSFSGTLTPLLSTPMVSLRTQKIHAHLLQYPLRLGSVTRARCGRGAPSSSVAKEGCPLWN